jgi:hypothetical protein
MNNVIFTDSRRRAWLASFLVAPVMALAACAGSAATAPSSGSPAPAGAASSAPAAAQASTHDACALVTEQEATTALGSDPGAGTPQGSGASQACMFRSNGLVLQVGLSPNGTRELLDTTRAAIQKSYLDNHGTVVEAPGMGDANFVASSPHGGGCYVLKGTVMAHITLVNPTVMASAQATMTTLCGAMAGRL